MKLAELETTVKSNLVDAIEDAAEVIGFDKYDPADQSDKHKTGLEHILGLCGVCVSLDYVRGEFGSVYASCGYYNQRLTGRERIKDCTRFQRRGQMSLKDAISMAHLIEPNDRKIGF